MKPLLMVAGLILAQQFTLAQTAPPISLNFAAYERNQVP